MNLMKAATGATTGAMAGGCLVLLVSILTVVAAVAGEKSTSIANLIAVDYVPGQSGGFELTMAMGSGLVAIVAVGAIVGGVLALLKRSPTGTPPC